MKEIKVSHLSGQKSSAHKRKRTKPFKSSSLTKKNKITATADENIMGIESYDQDKAEHELEKFIFGGEESVLEELNSEISLEEGDKKERNASFSEGHYQKEKQDLTADSSVVQTIKPAWTDEDDNILVSEKAATLINCHKSILKKGSEKYAEYLKEKHMKIWGTPKWADLNEKKKSFDSDEESDEELLQKTRDFVSKSVSLPKGIIDIRKCQSFSEGKQTGIIKSIEFHPTSKVALVAGLNGIVTLYQVDGKINPKIQSVLFENFPIHTAHFTMDGKDIVVGSKKYGYFFYYDMIVGKVIRVPWEKYMDQMNVRRFQMSPDGKIIVIHGRYGNIHLLSAKTKEWIDTVKMNGEVYAINFNKDGSRMYTHGDTGKIYVWDMSSRRCIHRFNDQGCIAGTSISVSPNGEYIASGSDCGVVNVYQSSSVLSSTTPTPIKTLMNLTTEVTSLKFNSTSEILSMASSHKKNALKLVHFPSLSVFSNFPNMSKNFLYPNSLDISLNSGYLSFGNNVGTAYLYRLRHFGNY